MDARRAADRLGIPFYVWDFSERFRDDVIEDFVAEYSAGRTPNPCMRCNERIKFAAVLEKALDLGFDAVCTGHYAILREGPSGEPELHRASDAAKDQSYVLGVLTARAADAHALPARRYPVQGARAGRGGGAWTDRGPQARQPRHLLHPGRRHARLARRPRRRRTGRDHRPLRRGRGLARGCARVHGRPAAAAWRSACPHPMASPASCWKCVRSPTRWSSARRRRSRPRRSPGRSTRGRARRRCPPNSPCHVQIRAHADPVPARAIVGEGVVTVTPDSPLDGVAPGQTAVLYDGTRVLGQFTIDRTVSALPVGA